MIEEQTNTEELKTTTATITGDGLYMRQVGDEGDTAITTVELTILLAV